jgi:thiol-disulfide isomerase/thioredoxin
MTTRHHWTRRRWLGVALAGQTGWTALPAPAAGPAEVIDWPALVDIDGRTVAADSWRGVPAVLVFWATDCAYCRRHNAHVDRLFRSVDAQRLRVVGAVMEADALAARHYMAAQDYRFPVVADNGRLRARFTARRVVPMTCTVGADGRLLQCIPGEMAGDDVLALAGGAKA